MLDGSTSMMKTKKEQQKPKFEPNRDNKLEDEMSKDVSKQDENEIQRIQMQIKEIFHAIGAIDERLNEITEHLKA